MSTIEEAVILQNAHHVQTSTALNQISTQLIAFEAPFHDSATAKQPTKSDLNSILAEAVHGVDNTTSTQLRISTNMPLKPCNSFCNCQCHIHSKYQTPHWLSAIIGTLFYSSTSTPSLDIHPCNVKTCLRSQPSSSVRLTYYFTSWMMRTALVYTSWNNLKGENSTWTITMPREIPSYSPIWHYIQGGFVEEVQKRLDFRYVSPYDVYEDGVSLLCVSMQLLWDACWLMMLI